MCNFFSLVSDPTAQKIMYCDWAVRSKVLSGELDIEPDSHTAIAKYHGYNARQEDKLNKYEYNPLTKKFTIDQINNEIDDSASVERYCNEMVFAKVIPALVVKPIIHPFKVKPPKKITEKHLDLLKEWASMRDSVRASVRDSVRASVGDSVRDSMWDSVGAYTGSFFLLETWKYINHEKGIYPYQCLVDLWEQGLVPSFDGKKWRLHGGEKGKILWEGEL